MGRVKSRGGCSTCRTRRKKCPEQKPICESCLRLGLKCSYQNSSGQPTYTNRSVVLGVYQLPSPLLQTRLLPANTIFIEEEAAPTIIAHAPTMLRNLFLPTYTCGSESINELMQISLSFAHVSKAFVACFAAILMSQQGSRESLPQRLWDQASKSIQAVPSTHNSDSILLFTLAVAAMFMRVIESAGTGFVNDLSIHFNAGATLISTLQDFPHFRWSTMPYDLCVLVLEVFLFQATLAIFTPEQEVRASHHKFTEIYHLLTQLNPPVHERINRSPFHAGFYDLYAILYDVVLLHRSSRAAETLQAKVDGLEKRILEIQPTVTSTVSSGQVATPTEIAKVAETYNFYCATLLICVNALRAPSRWRDFRIAAAVQVGFKIFHDDLLFTGNTYSLLWPIQVLRCAISVPRDVTAFDLRFNELRSCFHGMPLFRAERLFRRVDDIGQQQVTQTEQRLRLFPDDEMIPRGMLLFRQKAGVLGQEF